MTREDRRPRVFETALTSTKLSAREKVFMILVTTVKPEYVNGKRRHGSKAMGPDGKFALHLDYLARCLGTTVTNVKKVRRGCQEKEHLTTVHAGTFGRPSTWQAQVVRGPATCGVTFDRIGTPYASEEPHTRGDATGPLVYRTPDQGDHAPEPGGMETAPRGSSASKRAGPGSVSEPEVCAWCKAKPCAPGCPEVDHPNTRRKSA